METTEEENIHNALNKALTEFSEKLKEEYRLHGFKTKEFFEVIDKIMGNFNHSPQTERSSQNRNKFMAEGTHVKKYTKKYSKRNGIHQVGLKEDKQ